MPENPDKSAVWSVTIYVEVRTPRDLWEAAVASYIAEGGSTSDSDHLGTADEPDVGNCLRQLADPGLSWPGTKILDSEAEGGFSA